MLEVKTTGRRGRTCGRTTTAGAASEAFARWLHHRYVPSNCHQRGGGISFRRAIRC